MTKPLTIFTVPDQWVTKTSVRDTTSYEKVVGTITKAGEELWVPHNPKKYRNGGGYRDGYSRSDVQERKLSLGKKMSRQFTDFFQNLLLEERWYDSGLLRETYDCHWFGFWLKGLVTVKTSTQDSLDMAESVVLQSKLKRGMLSAGEIGVIGGKSGRDGRALPEHTFVAVDDGNALQAMGLHGAISLSPQVETVQHYREISDGIKYDAVEDFGIFIPTTSD